jgi:hypothetical protein
MANDLFLGEGMGSLKELILSKYPGAVIEFDFKRPDGQTSHGVKYTDWEGKTFNALGHFRILHDGKPVLIAQTFVNMKEI